MSKRIHYFFDPSIGSFYYGENHPMKPQRISMTHDLVFGYGLNKKMTIVNPRRATFQEMEEFHDSDYVELLRTMNNVNGSEVNLDSKNNFGGDCPIFPGIFDFCSMYTGASLEAARRLNDKVCDIAINWSGGLHHARHKIPSGFCFINDIVLAILELLRVHPRVLYIDIDVHHGDAVQEAFYFTERVLTLSLHHYARSFFPGTGMVSEVGIGRGKNFSMNVPLKAGLDDNGFTFVFDKIVTETIQKFQPSVIVLQTGADSLAGDRLGTFNVSIECHGNAVKKVKSFGIPLLVLGGGGYTIENVARCWTYETSLLVNTEVDKKLPETAFHYLYQPLPVLLPNLETKIVNQNSQSYLNSLIECCSTQLKSISNSPATHLESLFVYPSLSERFNWLKKVDYSSYFPYKYLDD